MEIAQIKTDTNIWVIRKPAKNTPPNHGSFVYLGDDKHWRKPKGHRRASVRFKYENKEDAEIIAVMYLLSQE